MAIKDVRTSEAGLNQSSKPMVPDGAGLWGLFWPKRAIGRRQRARAARGAQAGRIDVSAERPGRDHKSLRRRGKTQKSRTRAVNSTQAPTDY